MTTYQTTLPSPALSEPRVGLRAAFSALFRRRTLTAEEVLALWERQKLVDQLAAERHAAALRHYPIGRVF
jgi:hypothetical protein